MSNFHSWKHLLLFAALMILLVVKPLAAGFAARPYWFEVSYSLVVLAAIVLLSRTATQRIAAFAFGIPTLGAIWAGHFAAAPYHDGSIAAANVARILFIGYAAASILRAIFRHPSVSIDSIFGAVCAYLLIGVAWGTAYSVVEAVHPHSFRAADEKTAAAIDNEELRSPILIYYSFITLTTVGYGDITPASPAARTLTWLEAMTGQFYIAVLVSALVGIRISQMRPPASPDAPPDLRNP